MSIHRTLRLGLARGRMELLDFSRTPAAVVFGLAFPAVLLVLLGSIFDDTIPESAGTTVSQYMVPGVIAIGVMTAAFLNLAISLAHERSSGTIKRLAATPLPVASYFIGKVVMVLVISILSVTLLLLVGVTMFGVSLPSSPSRWFTFAWVLLLGIVACTLLGIAISRVPMTGSTAPAIINPPYLVLQFVSGTFLEYGSLATPLRWVANIFPLRWMALGMRSVFLPDAFLRAEPGGSWQHGLTLAVLAAWSVGGYVVVRRTFRWRHAA